MLEQVLFIVGFGCVVSHSWVPQMEDKNLYEGDIQLDPDEKPKDSNQYASIRGGRWPNGIVPYDFGAFARNPGSIEAAIAQYHKYTCLKFVKRTNQRTYITFHSGGGCSSPVGYRSGRTNSISLGGGCHGLGTVMHEIGHSIGLYHEQSRPDRDNYVTINWNNIQSSMKYNFNKHDTRTIDSLGTPYDFRSMMHYGSTAFGGRRRTISTKNPENQGLIGNRRGFSEIDKKQINLMYKCNVGPTPPPTPPPQCKPGEDLAEKCGGWARTGYCTSTNDTYKKIMALKCCKSCKESAVCGNDNARCDEWAGRGECKKNPKYMLNNCRKACNECT